MPLQPTRWVKTGKGELLPSPGTAAVSHLCRTPAGSPPPAHLQCRRTRAACALFEWRDAAAGAARRRRLLRAAVMRLARGKQAAAFAGWRDAAAARRAKRGIMQVRTWLAMGRTTFAAHTAGCRPLVPCCLRTSERPRRAAVCDGRVPSGSRAGPSPPRTTPRPSPPAAPPPPRPPRARSSWRTGCAPAPRSRRSTGGESMRRSGRRCARARGRLSTICCSAACTRGSGEAGVTG